MIFLVQFGINKHSQIFQRLQIALALRARAIFCSLWKICSCLFIPNCTRNHLITYTNWPGQKISRIATHAFTFLSTLPVVFENLQIVLVAALLERFPRISQNMHDTWLSCPFSFAIGPVRYINILTWLRGFRVKIVNFLSFFCLSIPERPNIEVCPKRLRAM